MVVRLGWAGMKTTRNKPFRSSMRRIEAMPSTSGNVPRRVGGGSATERQRRRGDGAATAARRRRRPDLPPPNVPRLRRPASPRQTTLNQEQALMVPPVHLHLRKIPLYKLT